MGRAGQYAGEARGRHGGGREISDPLGVGAAGERRDSGEGEAGDAKECDKAEADKDLAWLAVHGGAEYPVDTRLIAHAERLEPIQYVVVEADGELLFGHGSLGRAREEGRRKRWNFVYCTRTLASLLLCAGVRRVGLLGSRRKRFIEKDLCGVFERDGHVAGVCGRLDLSHSKSMSKCNAYFVATHQRYWVVVYGTPPFKLIVSPVFLPEVGSMIVYQWPQRTEFSDSVGVVQALR